MVGRRDDASIVVAPTAIWYSNCTGLAGSVSVYAACQSTPASAQRWEERIAVAQKQGMEALIEPTIARWFPPDVVNANPPYLDRVRNMIGSTPVNGFVGCAAALADHNYADAVATVRRPVLFLVGEKDGVNPAAMRKLHQGLCLARVTSSSRAQATSPISLSRKGSTAPFASS